MEVTIKIRKPYIRDFMRYLFGEDPQGFITVKHNLPFGKYICSLVGYSEQPVTKEGDTVLRLPQCDALATGPRRFLYMTEEAVAKINDYIEALFELDLDRYVIQGRKMGYQYKDIINAYIASRQLISFDGDTETLKKRVMRQTTRDMSALQKTLFNKSFYRDTQIRNSIKNDIKML